MLSQCAVVTSACGACGLASVGAGAAVADVGRMTVLAKDQALRPLINEPWLKYFPDEHDWPARHTIVVDLARGMLVQPEIIAVLKRRHVSVARRRFLYS